MKRIIIESKDINIIRRMLRQCGFECGKKGWMRGNSPAGIYHNGKMWFTVIE